jgi:hypothetical protein
MSNYQSVHINNLDIITQKALALVPKQRLDNTGLFYLENNKELFLSIPELREELIRLELLDHVYGIAVYVVYSSTPMSIHEDSGYILYSLNLPLSGYENTFVNFYQPSVPAQEKISHNGNRFFHYPEADCELVDQLEMTTPHIINVKVPHAVVNQNTEPRITMLIRFNLSVGTLL